MLYFASTRLLHLESGVLGTLKWRIRDSFSMFMRAGAGAREERRERCESS